MYKYLQNKANYIKRDWYNHSISDKNFGVEITSIRVNYVSSVVWGVNM